MNIHQEKEHTGLKDTQLLRRMTEYALPYWKSILVCLALAFLIVLAELARPYLLKIAIDDHINGLSKPMLTVSASEPGARDRLKAYGKDMMESGGELYVRLKASEVSKLEGAVPSGMSKVQIVETGGKHVLIRGWLPGEADSLDLTLSEPQTKGGLLTLAAGGVQYGAQELDSATLQDFRSPDYRGFLTIGLLFLAAVAGGSLLTYWQNNLLQYTGQHIIFNIRQQLFAHLSKMSMSFFDRNPVGRLVVRVTQDTESLNQLYSQVIVNLVKDVIMILGVFVIMLQLSVKLSLIAFAVLPVLAVITVWYRTLIRDAQRRSRIILSRLNSFLAENLSGIRITQMFIREDRQREQFDHLNGDYYKAGMTGTVVNSIFQPAIGFLGNLSIALLLWYGGAKVLDGAVTFGVVYAFTHYIRQFFQPLQSLAEKYNQIQTAMVGADRIVDMLNEKPGITDHPEPVRLQEPVQGEIRFENVWFAYNAEEWVLKDVSFTIRPGQTVAFVGATGAGKSSIIQLINRFYDVQKGRITLDGTDIRLIPLDKLRRTISVVQQDVFLFTGDIAHNIRLNNASITDRQVEEAARMVHLDDWMKKLPDGYRTMLGERGVTLSLGERQLLSFARAVAFRPQILILDEATSNIDTETELAVQDALYAISKGRTTLIVAHRLSTIQHADQIIVMHKGKVRESGSHFQLLAKRGYYYKLYELQYKEREREQLVP
ncbi:ABC transporter ATP-binding protein [Gorillibacterium sp. sgz5001074]|uniref:ABC transporter ATP-binding protein n=1 Tax=Gorillibacterium sp. sgz5001074 TaxID=3446695 RepID=UPI003F665815